MGIKVVHKNWFSSLAISLQGGKTPSSNIFLDFCLTVIHLANALSYPRHRLIVIRRIESLSYNKIPNNQSNFYNKD